jgi:flavin-dependent dehydrogenase
MRLFSRVAALGQSNVSAWRSNPKPSSAIAATPIRIGPARMAEHPVVVVGAGPVGLSLAIDLAQRGQSVVLLDDADRIGEGSRAICFSKRSLEFWDRLGVGQRMVDKGVVWSVGKIFHGASQLYQFNLLPEQGHKRPAFINLQQFYAEAYLVDRVGSFRDRPALAQQGDRAGAAQRPCRC